jgi:hypothetical protein
MTQKRVDLRLAAAKCHEGFDGGSASPGSEHFAPESRAHFRI